MVKPVLTYPDYKAALTTRSLPLYSMEGSVLDVYKDFIEDMKDTCKANGGVGLAAVQLGSLVRMAVVLDPETARFEVLINPEIKDKAIQNESMEEGCLSLPGIIAKVSRPTWVVVRYYDEDAVYKTVRFEGLAARVVQHEIDHMDGKLIGVTNDNTK